MNCLELADAFEIMKKGVIVGVLIVILLVLLIPFFIISPVGFAAWLVIAGLAFAYPQYLLWRSFNIIYINLQRPVYNYARYFLFIGMVALPAIFIAAAVYFMSLVASEAAPPGGDPAIDFLVRLAGWLVGVVIAAFWYKVWSAVEVDTGVDLFAAVAWVEVLAAVVSFIPVVSWVMGIVFLILLYLASDRAERKMEQRYFSNSCGPDEFQQA